MDGSCIRTSFGVDVTDRAGFLYDGLLIHEERLTSRRSLDNFCSWQGWEDKGRGVSVNLTHLACQESPPHALAIEPDR
jgi:hypothetical protein